MSEILWSMGHEPIYREMLSKDFHFIKEYQFWGHCPTYKNDKGELRFVERVAYEDKSVLEVMDWPQMREHLAEYWEPRTQEELQWYYLNIEKNFGYNKDYMKLQKSPQ